MPEPHHKSNTFTLIAVGVLIVLALLVIAYPLRSRAAIIARIIGLVCED